MAQTQLTRQIADQTGESLATVHRLGFQPDPGPRPEPDEVRLVLDCPFCGRAVPYPGRTSGGAIALAECLSPRCDVEFDFTDADVYAA